MEELPPTAISEQVGTHPAPHELKVEGSASGEINPVCVPARLEIFPGKVATVFKVTGVEGKTGTGYVPGSLDASGSSEGMLNYLLWPTMMETTYVKLVADENFLSLTFLNEQQKGLGGFMSPWSKDAGVTEGALGYFKWEG